MSQVSKRDFQTLRGQAAIALRSFNAQLAELQYTVEAQGLAIVEELKLDQARLATYRARVDAVHEQIRAAGALGTMLAELGSIEMVVADDDNPDNMAPQFMTLREIGARQGMYEQPALLDLYTLLSPTPAAAPPSLLARMRGWFRRPAPKAAAAPVPVVDAERQAA